MNIKIKMNISRKLNYVNEIMYEIKKVKRKYFKEENNNKVHSYFKTFVLKDAEL